MKKFLLNALIIAATIVVFLSVKQLMSDDDGDSGNGGGSGGGRGDFVFLESKYTGGLPVLSCKIPDGCVAATDFRVDLRDQYTPTRYSVQAIDPRDGSRVGAHSQIILASQFPFNSADQCRKMCEPQALAANIGRYFVDMYGLKNTQLISANGAPWNGAYVEGLMSEAQAQARQGGVQLTDIGAIKVHCRYRGSVDGRPKIVTAVFSCLYQIIGNLYTIALAQDVMTACCDESQERETMNRLVAFSTSVYHNPAFIELLDRLLKGLIDTKTRGLQKMGQELLRIGRELEDAYASGRRASQHNAERRSAATARFSDAMRGEECVRNPFTGDSTYISTDYDHCAVNSSGQQLYWNGDFDPNVNAAFNSIRWEAMK